MLGTVQFGLNYGIANVTGKPSYDTAKEILKTTYNLGITALDTAAAYGDSEEVLGKALTELGIKDKVTVVTKVPPIPENTDPEKFIKESLISSLKRLKLDVLPVVLLHSEKNLPYFELLQSFVKTGLIQEAGISLDSLEYANKANHIKYLQVPCNVLDHRFDNITKDESKKRVFIRSVYLQGMLLMDKDKIPFPEIVTFREKLEQFGLPLAELCMRYLLSISNNVSVLTGVDTVEQLKENAALAAKGKLDDTLMKEISNTVPLLSEKLIRPSLWNLAK
jgi:aryl-alcohol dehydrogenase-like predicted oxidoreductase